MAKMTTILGPDGSPVEAKSLEQPIRTLDPLSWTGETLIGGMTPARLAAVLRDADRWDDRLAADGRRDYFRFVREMERDPHYHSVLSIRRRAVSSLAPHVEAASDDAKDVERADAARAMLRGLRWSRTLDRCLDGLSKGFAALEMRWATDGGHWRPVELVLQPQEDFSWNDRELVHRDWVGAEPRSLEPFRWVVHCPQIAPVPRGSVGLSRIVAWSFLMKRYSLSDWARFLEGYGMPIRVGRYDERASEDDRRKLLRAVRSIGSDSAAIVPESMPIEFIGADHAPAEIYEKACRYHDEQMSKAVLGQTMTSDSGSSRAQAEVHDQVRQDVREADASELAETLQEQLLEPYVAMNFGIPDAYPRLQIPMPRNDDRAGLVSALRVLVPLGLRVEASVVRDRLGLPDPEVDAEILEASAVGAPGLASARRGAGVATAAADPLEELDDIGRESLEEWEQLMDPVLEPVRQALTNARSFEEFAAALPALRDKMDTEALTETLARAAFVARGMGDATDG